MTDEKETPAVQVGGDHYSRGEFQHWDWVVSQNLSYLAGNATKYICRHGQKGGQQDLEKAVSYYKKLVQTGVDTTGQVPFNCYAVAATTKLAQQQGLGSTQTLLLVMTLAIRTQQDVRDILSLLTHYMLQEYPPSTVTYPVVEEPDEEDEIAVENLRRFHQARVKPVNHPAPFGYEED